MQSLLDPLNWVLQQCPCVCNVDPPVVFKSWLLLACLYMGLTLRLADCEAQPRPWHAIRSAVTHNTKQNLPQQGLVQVKISLWICCLWSLLALALMLSESSHWVCWFWASLEGLWCRPMSDAACDCSWATYLEIQSDPQYVATSAGFGWMWKRPSCTPRPAFTRFRPRGRLAKTSRHPEILLHFLLPAGCLIGSVTQRASGSTQVAWGGFSVNHQV